MVHVHIQGRIDRRKGHVETQLDGGSGASSAGEGAAGGDAPDSGLGADGYLDRESASDDEAGQGSGPDSDDDTSTKRAQGQESDSDDNEDPDWEPPRGGASGR